METRAHSKKNFFFILSIGRSGTDFLANLLNSDEKAVVKHEPYPEDSIYFGLRYYGGVDTVLNNYYKLRFQNILALEKNKLYYGEVNSYLRYEIEWLKENFNPVLIHLVRDGRAYVRSALKRQTYTPYDKQVQIVPRESSLYADRWQSMDRFQKLCWYWKHTNEHIAEKIGSNTCVKFEYLLSDYTYFKENITDRIGLTIDKQTWQAHVKEPKNVSESYWKRKVRKIIKSDNDKMLNRDFLSHHSNWSMDLQEKFDEICFSAMKTLGYY